MVRTTVSVPLTVQLKHINITADFSQLFSVVGMQAFTETVSGQTDRSLREVYLNRLCYLAAMAAGTLTWIILRLFGIAATTFPGRVAITLYPGFLRHLAGKSEKIIFITGTNGKTTTSNLVTHILRQAGHSVYTNREGANLRTGIAAAAIRNPGRFDYAVIEIDEGVFPLVIKDLKPHAVAVTNFFRDQLDRYGEIDTTVRKVSESLADSGAMLVLNADDPFVSRMGLLPNPRRWFGLTADTAGAQGGTRESVYCPVCSSRLEYSRFYYAQVGHYSCGCGFKNPAPDTAVTQARFERAWDGSLQSNGQEARFTFAYGGLYNLYNVAAAAALTSGLGIPLDVITRAAAAFDYRLGRLEQITLAGSRKTLVLVKNPAGCNQVLDMVVRDPDRKNLSLVLNDNTADGRDISWIWDVDYEVLAGDAGIDMIRVSGLRGAELRVRLKYANVPDSKIRLFEKLDDMLDDTARDPMPVYILPTYTALFYSRSYFLKAARRQK